jgi:predicted XRE-type DNA-binding protein
MKTKIKANEEKLVFFDNNEAIARDHKKNPERKKAYDELGPDFEIISEFVRLRNENKISQKKLEEISKIPQSNISRFERGRIRNFSFVYLNRLVRPLGYRAHVFFEKVK